MRYLDLSGRKRSSSWPPLSGLRKFMRHRRMTGCGQLFAMVARLKPDIYRKAHYPDGNNRPPTSPQIDSKRSRREKRPFKCAIDSISTIRHRLHFSAYEALRQLQQPYTR